MRLSHIFAATLALLTMIPVGWNTAEAATRGKVLVVASSESKMTLADGSQMNVGFFLNEFAVPTEYLAAKGYEIVLATPSGQAPVMDASSNDKKFFGGNESEWMKAQNFVKSLSPISLQAAINGGLDEYVAIFVPGGHAPMTDLMQSPQLGEILRYFHAHQKPTAFICHGPVAMLSALPDAATYRQALVNRDTHGAMAAAKDWIYAGYEMTVLSDAEEWPGEVAKGTEMPFHVEQALQIAGGHMREDALYGSHVVRDRELITGQNPASDKALAQALDEVIREQVK